MNRSLCFGAVLWDIIGGKKHIGGAPLNVAANLASLGWQSYMLSCVGDDALGVQAAQALDQLCIRQDFLGVNAQQPTGTSIVTLTASGTPSYVLDPKGAYNFITLDDEQLHRIAYIPFDVLCFGTFEQQGEVSRSTLYTLLDHCHFKDVFFDVNIRENFCPPDILRKSLSHATILKINDEEAPQICEILYAHSLPLKAFCERISNDFHIPTICITQGSRGCDVYANGVLEHIESQKVTVVDTVGAGDGFSAAFIATFKQTGDPFRAAHFGNVMGGYVAACEGAIPPANEHLCTLLELVQRRIPHHERRTNHPDNCT